jgi:hypothetical protein
LESLGPEPVPFGYCYGQWAAIKEMMNEGDELWLYSSFMERRHPLALEAGLALVRNGEVVASMMNLIS